MNKNFVMLTKDILKLDALTSTDQIVLAYRLGFGNKPFFARLATIAAALSRKEKTVEKSITKLRKLGYWPHQGDPARVGGRPALVGSGPTRGGDNPTGVGDKPTGVGDKKSVSPLTPCVLLDNTLDIKLEKYKIAGLDHSVDTGFKKLGEENSVYSESQKVKINVDTGSEASVGNGSEKTALAVPLRADGRPMTKADMVGANFEVAFAGKPEPYPQAQIAAPGQAGLQRQSIADEFERVFGSETGSCSHRPSVADEFERVFGKNTD